MYWYWNVAVGTPVVHGQVWFRCASTGGVSHSPPISILIVSCVTLWPNKRFTISNPALYGMVGSMAQATRVVALGFGPLCAGLHDALRVLGIARFPGRATAA